MIIGLVGFIGSGKNTVAEYFEQHNFKKDSFAAPLKDAVSDIFGWPRNMLEGDTDQSRLYRESVDQWWSKKLGNKYFTPRYALQIIGTEIFRDNFNQNIWLHSLESRYMSGGRKPTVISDCRFKNELGLIKTLGGKVIRVKRGPEPHWFETAKLAADGDNFSQHTLADMGIHQSEWDWVNVRVDYTVTNDGTLDELNSKLADIVKEIT